MPVFSGTAIQITRMLGQVDQDDPTNLPLGCAAVCLNTDFTRDTSGIKAWTRAGNCLITEGHAAPGTGLYDFQYEPEAAGDSYFQMLLRFTLDGVLEYESPAGTGRMVNVPAGMFTLPQNSHKIDTQAGNLVWSAYSNLTQPTAGLSGFNPKTLNLDPLGMKPYGWRWLPATLVYAGEVCTPSNASAGPNGNGHTYQAQTTGSTGANEPNWPVTEAGTVVDGGVTWKELTMVIANRLAAPPTPVPSLVNGGSTFANNTAVYVVLTLTNSMGETIASPSAMVTTTAADQTVQVPIPALAALPGWLSQLVYPFAATGMNVYVATTAANAPPPPQSAYQKFGSGFALGTVASVTGPGTGVAPPVANTARVTLGQLPTPDAEPVLTRAPGGGAFPAGRDVYVALAYANANGQTPLGPANNITDTLADDAVQVTLSQPAEYPQLNTILVYEADVPTGAVPPPNQAFSLVGSYAATATVTITATATGANPATVNTTGPGGNIAADSATGGINNTQGYRYAVPCWINRNETFSGFTQAAVSQYDVDEDGWEIAVFNVPLGPANIIGRAINWTTADSTPAGGFWWIGLVDLQIPTQNSVYPNSFPSNGVTITPTVLLDNVTTSATFNFTDSYLESSNNTTDRLRVTAPPQGVRVDYLTSCDRLAIAGVPGLTSGLWISLGSDYESYYGDTSPVPLTTQRGETCWGCVEFRGAIYAMRSQSAVVITPGTGDPASWTATQRWGPTNDAEGVGPCGPRAFAANGQFIIFVHRTGVYRFDGTQAPDLMTKEIPRMWGWINWEAAETIAVMIDNDTHTVRIQVPVGNSTVPNKEFCLSYLEGWQNPIHFTSFLQKEITQEAARRWSFNDVSAFVCRRILRNVTNPPQQALGPDGTLQKTTDWNLSQLAYTSTAPDGLVNARTPGRYDDNGAGIDWKYQTVSAQDMQKLCKPEGVITRAYGYGKVNVSFVAGRRLITGSQGPKRLLPAPPMELTPHGFEDYTSKPARALDAYWNVLYDNGKQPGVWGVLDMATVYVIPVKVARGSLDSGQ